MKYVELLKDHYDNIFKANENPIMDEYGHDIFEIKFIIYGAHAEDKLGEIENIIRNFYNEIIVKDENEGEVFRYIDYNTVKSTRTATGIVTDINAEKTLAYISSKETGYFSIAKHKILDGLSITNEKRHGECYAKIEYSNSYIFFKDPECTTYLIEITFPYYKYLEFSKEKKKWMLNFMKTSFCNLNAIGAVATFYNNFYYYTSYGTIKCFDFKKADGSVICGVHWCNMLCEKQVNMLGGVKKIKDELNDECIFEVYKTKNGENAVFIQLAENEYDMQKNDLYLLRDMFISYMPKIEKKRLEIHKQLLAGTEKGTDIYNINLNSFREEEFINENIYLLDENDMRWV